MSIVNLNGLVGTTFENNNGTTYWVLYVNKKLDRVLLLEPESKTYIGAYGLDYTLKYWSQGHYFMFDFESAVNYVLGKEVK